MSYVNSPVPDGVLRLHLNENTAGCSPAVLAAIHTIGRTDVGFYPDYRPVTAAVERWLNVPAGWVQLTNGLDEGLHVAAIAAAQGRADAATVIVEPAFDMYAACAEAARLRQIRVGPSVNLAFPLRQVIDAIEPVVRLISVTDPGNPSGLGIPPGAVDEIAESAAAAIVFVDEAYADFSGRTSIGPLLDRRRNVVVGRTFAKGHGLAGLRVGALVAHPETLTSYRRLLPPFSLNICAVRALEAALDDPDYLRWYVGETVRSRELIYDFCRRHRLTYWPSEANFVLVRIGDAAGAVVEALGVRGIAIRDRTAAPGCAGCVRITAGVVAHTQACLDAMEETLAAIAN